MLRLKDWPTPSAVEEFILCQRPEFLVNFPLIEFVHYKWGILNLAAKLPHDTMQNEVGPKLVISYGTHKELEKGDPVANLQVNMGDMVGSVLPLSIFISLLNGSTWSSICFSLEYYNSMLPYSLLTSSVVSLYYLQARARFTILFLYLIHSVKSFYLS